MATLDKSTAIVSILADGMTPSLPGGGVPWIQNLWKEKNSWATRPGFGVVCEYDTRLSAGKYEDPLDPDARPIQVGLERHLGSHLIDKTSFGHKQVVSVWRARAYTTNMATGFGANFEQEMLFLGRVYVVKIYDLTTDELHEEVLHAHTSEENARLATRHGNYESTTNQLGPQDDSTWIDAGVNEGNFADAFNVDDKEYFFFKQLEGQDQSVRLYFGSERAGAFVYCPSDFKTSGYHFRERTPQSQADAPVDYKDPYSESPIIVPLRVRNGSFFDDGQGQKYVDQATFGKPQAACVLGTRMVWASGNLLFYSDPEVANAISAPNFTQFPSRIVGVAPTLGNLLVWTESETFYYNPTADSFNGLISGGTLRSISSTVGILNPNAWCAVDGAIYWIDKTGIWKNYGNVTITAVSAPLNSFFIEAGMSNSLTNFYTASGAINITGLGGTTIQPKTFYNWSAADWTGTNCIYNPSKKQVIFCIPILNLAIVMENDGFHVWNFESVVNTVLDERAELYFPAVAGIRNLPFPWLLSDNDREIYMVAGPATNLWKDQTVPGGTQFPQQPPRNTIRDEHAGLLLKLGRGGGLDRSLQYLKEDRRRVVGEYQFNQGTESEVAYTLRDEPRVYFEKLRTMTVGRVIDWLRTPVTISAAMLSPCILPIFTVPWEDIIFPTGVPAEPLNVQSIIIKFKFDNVHWEPILNVGANNTNEVAWDLPPERLDAVDAYSLGTADTGLNLGVTVTDNAGVADPTGNNIKICINGGLGSWKNAPNFNFTPRFKNALIEIYFKRKTAFVPANENVWDLGIEYLEGEFMHNSGPFPIPYYAPAYIWRDHTPTDNPSYQPDNLSFQAVDWCYQTEQLNGPEDTVVKLRGINTVLASSNVGEPQFGKHWDGWPIRLFNAIFSTNYKQFAAQFVDQRFTNPTAVKQFLKPQLRDRVLTSTTPQVLQPPIFGNSARNNIVWADDPGSANTPGELEIGDAPQDEIRASADVKGEGVAVQLFGHVMGAAEKIRIVSAKAVVRMTGAMRRKGRP